jgi:MFS family permease
MRSKSLLAQIGILILATSIIQLANGFFGTFISLRVAIEDFGPTISGLVLSSYFVGFTLGALRCERIIERVGHIRAYAALAGMVVAATAAMPLLGGAVGLVDPACGHRFWLLWSFHRHGELAQRQGRAN